MSTIMSEREDALRARLTHNIALWLGRQAWWNQATQMDQIGWLERKAEDLLNSDEMKARDSYLRSREKWQLSPPPGWFVFGSHVDKPEPLEFWGEAFSEDGMPIWERPREA